MEKRTNKQLRKMSFSLTLINLTTVNPTHLAHSYLIGLKIKTK